MSGPWRFPSYRMLLAGQTVSDFGNALTPVALAFAVLDLGGSATQLGLVIAAYSGAEVLTVLFGGVLGDRLPRRVLLQGSAALAALTQTVIAAGLIGGWSSLPLLAAISVVNGCVSAISRPSSQALTAQTVDPADLSAAISIRRLASNAAMVAGFGVAGLLVVSIGSGWTIAVDAATFAIAAICFAAIRVPVGPSGPRASLLADLRAGAIEVFRHTWLWALIAQALVYHLFYGGAQGVLGPIVVKADYGEAAWGWALAVLMTGFMAGGLVSLWFRPTRGLFAGTTLLALTACFPAALAFDAGLALVLAGAFLHGFGLEIFSVNWDLAIQQNIAPDKLARVYSFDLIGSFVARPLGLAVTGPIGLAVGYSRWLTVVAGVMAGSVLLVLLVPSVRQLNRRSG
jgi:predicted MFS family arabinose efflux permease